MNDPIQNEKNVSCGNCYYALGSAKYCPECGQKNTDGRITVKEFFSVVVNTVFNLESKFFQTIGDIFKPGKLTSEWFKGRHKPYFHPIRLFIVTALLLVAVLSLFITDKDNPMTGTYTSAQKAIYRKSILHELRNFSVYYLKDEKEKAVIDSLSNTMKAGIVSSGRNNFSKYGKKFNLPELKDKSPEEIVAYYKNEIGPELTDSIIHVIKTKRWLTQDSVQLNTLFGNDKKHKIANEDFLNLTAEQNADKYAIKGFFDRLHFKQRIRLHKGSKKILPFILGNSIWIALLMMPFFAFILRLLYYKQDYYYVEHLIFSFHTHAFAFILFALICLFMKLVIVHPLIVLSGFLLLFIYLYKSLRKVYQQGKWMTLAKLVLANAIYVVLFGGFALLGSLVSMFLF